MTELLVSFFGTDLWGGLIVVLNLILIESLLSVDNAAVLATMVLDLPKEQREKALKYGIIGAYVFRGLCLLLAQFLVKVWWLKAAGGLYLLWLCYDYFKSKETKTKADDTLNKNENLFYKLTVGKLGLFWSTVALVEVMDLAFSIDNVFAAVAFTDKMGLIYLGVFIGILAMRFVSQYFIKLMEKYPALERSAFLVIGLLGLKLTLSLITHYYPDAAFTHFMDSESTDLGVSILTVLVFIAPVIISKFKHGRNA